MIVGHKLSSLEDNVYYNKDYGQLKFYYKILDRNLQPTYKELKSTNCTQDDLIPKENEIKTKYGFFRPESEIVENIKYNSGLFKCIEDSFKIYGHSSSFEAQNLVVTYELCKDSPSCKSDEEINSFLDGAQLVTLQN